MQAGPDLGAACQRCKSPAEKQLTTGNFKFAHAPGNPAPTNTGASTVDHDVDVIIGRDSQLRLAEMHKRQDYKRSVMRANRLETGEKLSRLDDGDYFVMTNEETVAAKKARLLNEEAMRKIKNFKERKSAHRLPLEVVATSPFMGTNVN
jgi:hypothetical protein